MSNRVYVRRTNRLCEFGFPIFIEYNELDIVQQDEPYDVLKTRRCCEEHGEIEL